MKYLEWLQVWLEYYVRPTAKPKTYEHYAYLIHAHIAPRIGDTEVHALSAMDLQKLISDLLKQGNRRLCCGIAASTVNTVITLLQGSFRAACAAGKSAHNPAASLRRPPKEKGQITCFSVNEQKKIEQTVLRHSKGKMLGILLCLYSGLRIGELLALLWTDIDFERGWLSVNKTCRDDKSGKGKHLIGSPKTRTSVRVIPLPKKILTILAERRKREGGEWVISEKGQAISVRSYQRSFALLLKRAGVGHKGFHALRHTFATRAIECGMDAKTLSEILGHKNPTITLSLYVHSLMEHKQAMMELIGKDL